MTTLYAYRKSFEPFSAVDGSVIVREPLTCTDSAAGPDSFGVQLNLTCRRLWVQNVVQVLKGGLFSWTLYSLDADGIVQLWSPISPPFGTEPFGATGDFLSLHASNEPSSGKVILGVGYSDRATELELNLADDLLNVCLAVVGQGGGSSASFTAGHIDCSLQAQEIGDLGFWTSPPENPPANAPWLNKSTDESSNLIPTITEAAASALKWNLRPGGTSPYY